ncbi:MAG: DUF3047 domain-containing protein [Deltaproteobacteria bacterium]|nr:DUF3047 domain-containing protein [Deltaproteobacteria bacterium]
MKLRHWLILITIITFVAVAVLPAHSQKQQTFFVDNFDDLNNWTALLFPKIETHSTYVIVTDEGHPFLKTESNASASALICKKIFNSYEFPRMKWRWKVNNVYTRGNALKKSGDDYPIRVYIMFHYDAEKANFSERITYGFAKLIYGEYPPHSSLNYIWANRVHDENMIISPYTDRSMMIVLEEGTEKVGKWVDEEVDIIRDYKRAFGTDPPERASIAIMNDSDNTQEASISYLDFIEVFK